MPFKKIKTAQAHCDIPCGIYETETLMTAATTCHKLTTAASQIMAEKVDLTNAGILNQLVRIIQQKELQAQICKDQIAILWADFFKEADFSRRAGLDQLLNKAAKSASAVKQQLDPNLSQQLIDQIQEIKLIFQQTQAQRNQ